MFEIFRTCHDAGQQSSGGHLDYPETVARLALLDRL